MLSMVYTLQHLLCIINLLFNLGRRPLFYCARYLKVNMNGERVDECSLTTYYLSLTIHEKESLLESNDIGNLYGYFS